jgi:hypothetical protein
MVDKKIVGAAEVEQRCSSLSQTRSPASRSHTVSHRTTFDSWSIGWENWSFPGLTDLLNQEFRVFPNRTIFHTPSPSILSLPASGRIVTFTFLPLR